ncbi:MAG TPA: PIN domain-containing protein [Nocardioidaceae bacterium]|nr:PIN domain-containing protein [Nocardioidaceae bacterium]
MGSLILDASVLIALLDRADPHYARAVEEVEAADQDGDDLVAPASAYSEALVAFAREARVDDAREAIVAMGIEVAPLDAGTAEKAAALRARHDRLRLPDAMVLATAQQLGGRMLSYDQRLQRSAVDQAHGADETAGPEPPTR